MDDSGLDPESVAVVKVETQEQAEREGFPGSPTIRIDGADIEPAEGEPAALACRVYRRADGRVSPLPDPDNLRAALAGAAGSS